jgi:hypothetical protein
MTKNNNAYYPCDVCQWNSPLNVVTEDNNGVRKSLCPIHKTNDDDDKKGKVEEKRRDEFKDDFRKAFIDIDKTAIEDIDTP